MKHTKIKFMNHASVIVSSTTTSILTDPWYDGDAFHKGWNLLFENSPEEITEVLGTITHIWISHEHPDHFSISFFKKYGDLIRKNEIKILFQSTRDRRVVSFLEANKLYVQEIPFNQKVELSKEFFICCIKDGFYDSALLIENKDDRILNLNDCEINNSKRAKEVFKVTGPVDVLLSQFSYAAWKGGKENVKWREDAAVQKIDTLKLQIETFSPNFVIPFASFIYFSNEYNFYLNDSINTPQNTIDQCSDSKCSIVVLKPNETFNGNNDNNSKLSLQFWSDQYKEIKKRPLNAYTSIDFSDLSKGFITYCDRINKTNNLNLMKLVRLVSPIKVFSPVTVKLEDTGETVTFDYLKRTIFQSKLEPMLKMHSESLYFMFNNSFGFDTLTVNGCFEEHKKNGFAIAAKSLAIENLNNLGMNFNFRLVFNVYIIRLFLVRLYRVTRKLDT